MLKETNPAWPHRDAGQAPEGVSLTRARMHKPGENPRALLLRFFEYQQQVRTCTIPHEHASQEQLAFLNQSFQRLINTTSKQFVSPFEFFPELTMPTLTINHNSPFGKTI
ncbi:hypothetical protein KKC1_24150 [Calderihabitans maritimus]|uniref:Uncharacterized protein n=1 Tax=Calderihabitans maritimus TaxID=1246530 RepID=A0A1Z5HUR2_9FIRM|nr:hypothetical protein KKC1_24150 [Calderihabitans maritimus]